LVAVAAAGLTLLVRPLVERTPPRPTLRFEVADAPGMDVSPDGVMSAISPDGSMLALVGNDTTRSQIWVRSLATLTARPLAGTEGAIMPFWSPDSRHLGFFTESQLKRVDVASGTVDVLCDVKRARGGTWNRAGQILFAPGSDGGLDLIPASGGDVRHVTTVDHARGETGHRFPTFLPDGKHFLFSVLPPQAGRFEIDLGSIDSPKREKLVTASSGALYASLGRLLYLRGTTLVAQRFDPGGRRLSGDPTPLREAVGGTSFSGGAGFSVSDNGVLAYVTFKTPQTRVAWVDLEGHEIQRLPFPPAPYGPVSLSPDRKRAVFMVWDTSRLTSLWIGDLERGTVTRFSDEPELCENPRWSPDGTRIAYFISQQGPQTIVVRPVDGSRPARRYLADDPVFKELCDWSPDSQSLMFGRQDPQTRFDLWVLPLAEGAKPWKYLGSPFNENGGAMSPDGRWASYLSDETGRQELYVQSFPKPGPKYQVTTGGGLGGGWPRSGSMILYGEGNTLGSITAADVLPGASFRLGPPRIWARLPRDVVSFDVAPGQKRLLVVVPTGKPQPKSITVVVNWPGALTSE
jgi:Tol biopolymer transport system component